MAKANKSNKLNLPRIPDKQYFTIGEAAHLCQVQPHVLRFWEQEFSQLSPVKRRGNRRYYQYSDVVLVRKIKELLYEQGYTIDGARQALQGNKTKVIAAESKKTLLKESILELEELITELNHYEKV